MRSLLVTALLISVSFCRAQDSLTIPRSSVLYGLGKGDSILIYQCRVIDPEKEPKIVSDYAQGPQVMYSLTDKIVIVKNDKGYSGRVYKTYIRDLPNRKFSGLKIKERPYWMFEFVKTANLSDAVVKFLLSIESKGQEAIEYDYAITKHTRNQVIFRKGKNFKQLLPHTNTRLADLMR
jgi:hypothetical protein